MSLLIVEHFHTASVSLRRNRLRTLLTILGVAIGVASITAILALSSGITKIFNHQVSGVSGSLLIVRPAQKESSLVDLSNPTPSDAYSTSPIAERDLQTIRDIKGVKSVAPLMTLGSEIRSGNIAPKDATVLATTPDFPATTSLPILNGQFIDSVTLENTAVIGEQLSVDLFGTDESAGKIFTIRGQAFTVIGILQPQSNPINYNNVDLDRAAIISLDSGKLLNGGVAQIQQINVVAKKGTNMKALQKTVRTALARNHSGDADTDVLVGKEIERPTSKLFILIGGAMTAIATISLLVGGIGIMNIMLVGVAERTREIGLRKAVGASNGAIVLQFMIEALIMSILAGILGYAGGYLVAFGISLLLPYDPVFTWQIGAIAAALSIGVGVIFGIYPALRAARKNVIESLRRYH